MIIEVIKLIEIDCDLFCIREFYTSENISPLFFEIGEKLLNSVSKIQIISTMFKDKIDALKIKFNDKRAKIMLLAKNSEKLCSEINSPIKIDANKILSTTNDTIKHEGPEYEIFIYKILYDNTTNMELRVYHLTDPNIYILIEEEFKITKLFSSVIKQTNSFRICYEY